MMNRINLRAALALIAVLTVVSGANAQGVVAITECATIHGTPNYMIETDHYPTPGAGWGPQPSIENIRIYVPNPEGTMTEIRSAQGVLLDRIAVSAQLGAQPAYTICGIEEPLSIASNQGVGQHGR